MKEPWHKQLTANSYQLRCIFCVLCLLRVFLFGSGVEGTKNYSPLCPLCLCGELKVGGGEEFQISDASSLSL